MRALNSFQIDCMSNAIGERVRCSKDEAMLKIAYFILKMLEFQNCEKKRFKGVTRRVTGHAAAYSNRAW